MARRTLDERTPGFGWCFVSTFLNTEVSSYLFKWPPTPSNAVRHIFFPSYEMRNNSAVRSNTQTFSSRVFREHSETETVLLNLHQDWYKKAWFRGSCMKASKVFEWLYWESPENPKHVAQKVNSFHTWRGTVRYRVVYVVCSHVSPAQRSAQELPAVERQDLDRCSVLGGQQMVLTGQNFTSDSKVIFSEKTQG